MILRILFLVFFMSSCYNNTTEQEIKYLKSFAKFDSTRSNILIKISEISAYYNSKLDVADEIYIASIKTGLDPFLICASITQESLWNPNAVSHAGAIGLMQIMPPTGKEIADSLGIKLDLFNPHTNITIGTCYLARMIKRYGVRGGLIAYNGGPVLAARWNGRNDYILYRETRDYYPAVLRHYSRFK